MTSWGVMAPRCVRRSAVYCQSPATAESKACSPVDQRLLRSDQTLEGHAANRGGHGRVTDRLCQPRSDRPAALQQDSGQKRGSVMPATYATTGGEVAAEWRRNGGESPG